MLVCEVDAEAAGFVPGVSTLKGPEGANGTPRCGRIEGDRALGYCVAFVNSHYQGAFEPV